MMQVIYNAHSRQTMIVSERQNEYLYAVSCIWQLESGSSRELIWYLVNTLVSVEQVHSQPPWEMVVISGFS
jgi:hypothetical protein